MALSYPLALPPRPVAAIRIVARSTVGVSRSPFSAEMQSYVHQGEWWEAAVEYPDLLREEAEEVIAFLLALNGREGSFLMGPVAGVDAVQRGSWAGQSPLVHGAGQQGKSLVIDGLAPLATVRAGDWFQLGSGSSARLHRVVQDATADASGQVALQIWPRLRVAPADNAPLTLQAPKGLWMLLTNDRAYDLSLPALYGISFECCEDLRP